MREGSRPVTSDWNWRTPGVAGALAFVALCACAALAVMLLRQPPTDFEHAQFLDRHRILHSHNEQLDAELLRARSGTVNHYDGIVRHVKERTRLVRLFKQDLPSHVTESGKQAIVNELAGVERLLAKHEKLVEEFKSEHAVLRNSVRVLPHLALSLGQQLAQSPQSEVSAQLNALFTQVLLFHDIGERQRIPQVRAQLDALERSLAQVDDPSLARQMQVVKRHAEVILARKSAVDDLFAQMAELPIEQHLKQLRAVYAKHHIVALEERATRQFQAILAGLAFIIFGAGFVILRLQASAGELRSATYRLEDALTSLEAEKNKQTELAELKGRFVSMTSHEFRTPLSVIMSSAELLEAYAERWTSDKRSVHLQRIQRAASQMKQMIEGVLLIGRSDAGMLKFEPHPADVASLCTEVVDGLRSDAETNHDIEVTMRGALDNVVIDARLVSHIVTNLLVNAMKYSPGQDSVSLAVRREADELVLAVRDKGIGISAEDRERLFEVFHRGKNVGTISGTGLGLAIVRKAVDLHGGRIDVESEMGEGTTFRITLPIAASSQSGNEPSSASDSDTAPRSATMRSRAVA